MAEVVTASTSGYAGRVVISGRYRYALWREWPPEIVPAEGRSTIADHVTDTCLFVMLNPSTADAHLDDPTLKRCIGFARSWGFGKLAVGNLYAWRSPKPADLATAPDPIGRECDEWLETLVAEASLIVAAWGASPHIDPERACQVCETVNAEGVPFVCLGLTADGHPEHPLYLPADTEPEPFDHWRELYG